jgi:hypothetical protein
MTLRTLDASTITAVNQLSHPHSRQIDRTSNGVTWVVLALAGNIKTYFTTDNGATSSAGSTISYASGSAGATPHAALFIDADDFAHLVYRDPKDGSVFYRRGTPNAGRTSYTWSSAYQVATAGTIEYLDVVAHAQGTGYKVHVAHARIDSSGNSRVDYVRLNVTSGGTISTDANVTPASYASTSGYTQPSITFMHTGDGKTPSATPHVWVAWSRADASNPQINLVKLAYSAGPTWTIGTVRTLDSTRYDNSSTDHTYTQVLFDGTRVCVVGRVIDATPTNWVMLYERDVADTATTVRTLYDGHTGTTAWASYGGVAFDANGNLFIFGQNAGVLYRTKWVRATQQLSANEQIDTGLDTSSSMSVKRAYSGNLTEIVYQKAVSGGSYPFVYANVATNRAPNAPTLAGPIGGTVIDVALSNTFAWVFSDPDAGDTQSKFDLQYRVVGAGSWTTVTQSTPTTSYTFAGSTFSANDYEWQVRTYDAQGVVGAWSTSGFFTAGSPPPAPTITDPTVGGVIGNTNYPISWSTSDPQDAYQVRRVADASGAPDTSTVYSDTGTVVNASARVATISFPTNNRYEHVQVRIRTGGSSWSSWASVRVQVAYSPPVAPTLTVSPADLAGVGSAHALVVTVADNGNGTTDPPIASADVYVREQGDTGPGLFVGSRLGPGDVTFYSPRAGVVYEAMARVYAPTGPYLDSAWVAASTAFTVRGVLLHDANDPAGTLLSLLYNESGANDSLSIPGALIAYQGRRYPVVEYGDSTATRTIEVSTIHSKGMDAIDDLRALIERRTVLCYRDKKGRLEYGVIFDNAASDTFYGADTALTLTVVDFDGA